MPITVDSLANALAGAQRLLLQKNTTASKSAGAFQSCWLATGNPGAGSAPPAYTAGSGYTCDDTTAGAIVNYTNSAGGGLKNRLAKAQASSAIAGKLIIADRLWSCGGMGFAASTYTVTTPGTLPARITDNGVGVEAWVEQFVAAGAASGTLTLNYKNVADAAKAGVIAAVVSAPVAGQMQPIPLQVGDTGVRSVVSAVNSATWTSGSFGITLLKRIVEIPMPIIGVNSVLDYAACALATVPDDACLMAIWQGNTTTATYIDASFAVTDV
jgi:hypothetical protein